MAIQVSSISQALAGNRDLLNIPVVHSNNNPGHALATALAVKSTGRALGLPTPPNSISPNLRPQAFRALKSNIEAVGSPPSQVDSDIDLQEAVEHANSRDRFAGGLPEHGDALGNSEGVGIITPAYLSKNHLADIILEKGPIAIRHVMNHLAQTVPGFGDIPPAKARRIVVAALESRIGGGRKGDVEFEKVGWGRWDAKVKGVVSSKTSRVMYPIQEGRQSAQALAHHSTPALRIPGSSERRPSKTRRLSHGSWTAEPSLPSRSEQGAERMAADVAEHEADKMSIDGDEEETSTKRRGSVLVTSRGPVRNTHFLMDASDTDEDDWASIGAAALRQGSLSSSAGRHGNITLSTSGPRGVTRRSTSFSSHPTSVPISGGYSRSKRRPSRTPDMTSALAKLDFTGVDVDSQEREAIAALMTMGTAAVDTTSDTRPATSTVIGSVVGSLAGLSLFLLLTVVLMRWWKRHHDVATARIPEPAAPTMTEAPRPPFIPAAAGFMNRLSLGSFVARPLSVPPPAVPTEQQGFQRLSGRKLPSQFSPGMEGPTMREFTGAGIGHAYASGSSLYPSGVPSAAENPFADPIVMSAAAGAGIGAAVTMASARNTTETERETMMPSPARTPVLHSGPVDPSRASHLAAPGWPLASGMATPPGFRGSFAGSPTRPGTRGSVGTVASRFREDIT